MLSFDSTAVPLKEETLQKKQVIGSKMRGFPINFNIKHHIRKPNCQRQAYKSIRKWGVTICLSQWLPLFSSFISQSL